MERMTHTDEEAELLPSAGRASGWPARAGLATLAALLVGTVMLVLLPPRHIRVAKDSTLNAGQQGTGNINTFGLMQAATDPVESPPKRDVYGCTCGPNSPRDGDNCCSGRFNAEGNNCIASVSTTCSSASGRSLCCRDGIHSWCCPDGTACLEQKAGKFNNSACTELRRPTVASVRTSWSIAGGGPGSPLGLKIQFNAGVTRQTTRTERNAISNAFQTTISYLDFVKLSHTFTQEWSEVVESSVTATESRSCSVECPQDYYLWVFRTSIQGIDTLPTSYQNLFASCSAVICSPFGLDRPPACPFGYQDDQKNGFPCCTNMDWLQGDGSLGKACASFSEWPNVDGVTCGADSCTALVNGPAWSDGGRCDKYCESFGHICDGAWEEVDETCEVKKEYQCHEPILGTSDMLCKCIYPKPPKVCESDRPR